MGAQVEPGDGDRSLVIPENITQTFLLVPAKLRLVALALFVFWKRAKKMLVFLATQDMVDFYRKVLEILFIGPEEVVEEKEEDDELTEEAKLVVGRDSLKKAVANRSPGLDPSLKLFQLHGSMSQKERLSVFQQYRTSTKGVLLSTDVAARGLDLPQVDWVIQVG